MRQNLQDSDAQQLGIYSGRLGSTRQVLDGPATLTREGSLLNFFDPGGANRDVFLPAMERGRFYIVAHAGSADELIVKDSGGAQLTYLRPFETALLVCSGNEWTALRGWEDLDVFTTTVDGLVPHPGPGSPGQLFLRNDGQWAQVQVSGIVDAFKFITDGVNTAVGNGPDTFYIRSADSTIIATVANNDPTFGDSVSLVVNEAAVDHNLLLNYVADQHVAHTGVVLTAGEGIAGGGDISVSRTFDLALSELTADAATALANIHLAGHIAAGSANRKFTLSYLNSILVHDSLSGFSANRHIDHTAVSIIAGIGLSGGGDISSSRTLNIDFTEFETGEAITTSDLVPFYDTSESDHNTVTFLQFNQTLDHATLTGYVADQHVAHSGVTLTAGAGLTGGGTIAASRTFDVGAGTGITVNANDVALDTTNTRNVDHASVSVLAGAGLSGGGTIAADRTLNLDINGQSADATPDNAADYLIEYDASAAAFKKVLIQNLITTLARQLLMSGVITPSQITSDQNNYNPTNLHTNSMVRLSSDASRAITGLDAGSAGELKFLFNTGSFDITIPDESASSTAANRFATNATITLASKTGIIMWYDGTSSRWRPLGGTGGGGGTFDINSLTEETAIAVGDFFPLYDVSASAQRKMTTANIFKAINVLTSESSPAVDDLLALYDTSASTTDKIRLDDLFKVINVLTADTTPAIDDLFVSYDTSASGPKKVRFDDSLKVLNGLTEDTSPDSAADFLLSYDTSASTVKKVKPQSIRGTWVLLNTLTASSSSSLDDTTSLTSTYSEYVIEVENLIPGTTSVQLMLRARTAGAFATTSYTSHAGGSANASSTDVAAGASSAGATHIPICPESTYWRTGGAGLFATIRVKNPSNTSIRKLFYGTSYGMNSVFAVVGQFAGCWDGGNGAITGFQLLSSSGNIASGTVKVYGIV